MAQPYVGEIRMFAGNFAPAGWMFCDGSLQAISENETLFQLIGTTYGGDGQSTFGIPNLLSRAPVHFGNGPAGVNYVVGQLAGSETVTLTPQQMPTHSHAELASGGNGSAQTPQGNVLAVAASTQPDLLMYGSDSVSQMNGAAIQSAGGNQPHENMQPFLCINYIISLFGIYPTQT